MIACIHCQKCVLNNVKKTNIVFKKIVKTVKQIVLSGRAMDYATRIRWSLAKAQDTPISIRDLNRDDPDLT